MLRLSALAVLLFTLTACGGSDGPAAAEPTKTPPPSTAATTAAPSTPANPADTDTADLRDAVQAYSDAFLTGDADAAYGLLSQRCQDRTSVTEFATIVDQAGQAYGDALELKTFEAEVAGDLARASYTYARAELDQDAEPWVRERGAWHEDDC